MIRALSCPDQRETTAQLRAVEHDVDFAPTAPAPSSARASVAAFFRHAKIPVPDLFSAPFHMGQLEKSMGKLLWNKTELVSVNNYSGLAVAL